jgi:hypothetical protein
MHKIQTQILIFINYSIIEYKLIKIYILKQYQKLFVFKPLKNISFKENKIKLYMNLSFICKKY